MRIIIVSPMVLIINRTQIDLKVFTFAVEVNGRVEGVKRNEIALKQFKKLDKLKSESNHEHCQGIVHFMDLTKSNSKRKFNANFDFFVSFSIDETNLSIPFKIQTINRQCVNVFRGQLGSKGSTVSSHDESVAVAVTVVKKDDIFYISIAEDVSPMLSIYNNTDFDLYMAQTDMTNYNTKNIQPHKEIPDDRFPWFQLVPKKQKVFYTPPIVNETFPEINLPEYGLILACVTANDAVRWSKPLKIDGTKKMILSLPMFGDICLDVNDLNRTATIDINYIQQDTDDSPANSACNNRIIRADKEENYKKTCVLNTNTRNIIFKLYVQQINWTVSRDSQSIISLNIDEILLKFNCLPRKLDIEFGAIQIDNELFPSRNYDFPVVVCNIKVDNASKKSKNFISNIWDISDLIENLMNGQNFKISLDFYKDGAIENVTIKMLPIRIYIEDTFITTILEIMEDCLPNSLAVEDVNNTTYTNCGFLCGPEFIRDQMVYFMEPLRIRTLRVEPLRVLISVHTCMRSV